MGCIFQRCKIAHLHPVRMSAAVNMQYGAFTWEENMWVILFLWQHLDFKAFEKKLLMFYIFNILKEET